MHVNFITLRDLVNNLPPSAVIVQSMEVEGQEWVDMPVMIDLRYVRESDGLIVGTEAEGYEPKEGERAVWVIC